MTNQGVRQRGLRLPGLPEYLLRHGRPHVRARARSRGAARGEAARRGRGARDRVSRGRGFAAGARAARNAGPFTRPNSANLHQTGSSFGGGVMILDQEYKCGDFFVLSTRHGKFYSFPS